MRRGGLGPALRSLVAILAILALSGCEAPPAPPTPCAPFADCLFASGAPLEVVVHASQGLGLANATWTVFAQEVESIAGRTVHVTDGGTIPALPSSMDKDELQALHGDPSWGTLHVYVLETVLAVEGEAASGLAFPGSPALFLFPATMDGRVQAAGLPDEDASIARRVLERLVLAHEFGHALGLVGCGIPMQRDHAEPGSCHSSNGTSLMAPRVAHVDEWGNWDRSAAFGPFGWDADDRADLAAARAA